MSLAKGPATPTRSSSARSVAPMSAGSSRAFRHVSCEWKQVVAAQHAAVLKQVNLLFTAAHCHAVCGAALATGICSCKPYTQQSGGLLPRKYCRSASAPTCRLNTRGARRRRNSTGSLRPQPPAARRGAAAEQCNCGFVLCQGLCSQTRVHAAGRIKSWAYKRVNQQLQAAALCPHPCPRHSSSPASAPLHAAACRSCCCCRGVERFSQATEQGGWKPSGRLSLSAPHPNNDNKPVHRSTSGAPFQKALTALTRNKVVEKHRAPAHPMRPLRRSSTAAACASRMAMA